MQSYLRTSRYRLHPAHAFPNNARKRHRQLDFVLTLATGLVVVLISLTAYLLVWGMYYRLPATPALVVDMRNDRSVSPHYVAICAALAANEHGFPGHAYVAWSDSLPIDLATADTLGFGPLHGEDQIPSLWQQVPGAVVEQASSGNQRNLNAVVAIVDQKTFEFTKQKSRSWKSDKFKVGSNDCVAYVQSLAAIIGLKTPDARYKYPQDFVEQLKKLNKDVGPPNQCPNQIVFAASR